MILSLLLVFLPFLQEEDPPLPFSDFRVEAKADVWFASFQGSGKLNHWFGTERDSEKDAPRLSFDREGRLRRTEPAPGADLQFLWENERHQYKGFGIRFWQVRWSESGTIDQSFIVDGTTVPAGSAFRSRLWMYSGAAHVVGGIRLAEAPIEIRGWGGCLFHQERFRMETASGDLKDGAGGLNFNVGFRPEVRPLPFLFVAGEFSASIGFGIPEVQGAISGGLAWNQFRLEGGYRHVWAGWDVDPIFRISVGGPFVGASISF